jgi:YHS domain-containing protein
MMDPVCRMTIDPDNAKGGSAGHARTYYLQDACREQLIEDPNRSRTPDST